MSPQLELSALFEAERSQRLTPAAIDAGWSRLEPALLLPVAASGLVAAPVKASLALFAKAFLGTSALLVAANSAGLLDAPVASPPPPARVAVPNALAVNPPIVAATPEAPSTAASPAEKPLLRPALAPTSVVSTTGPSSGAGFDEELRLIGNAKRELDRGQGHLAAAWLGEHASRYPVGAFASEREALKILVACSSGSEASRQAARRFAARFPSSPLLDRISRSCASGASEGTAKSPSSK